MKNIIETPGKEKEHVEKEIIKEIMQEVFSDQRRQIFCLKRPISSVQFSHSVVSDSFRPHESQHDRLPSP